MAELRQSFSDFLRELSTATDGSRQVLVDRFMSTVISTPLIEKECFAHFLYRGDAGSVAIPCDANEWSPIDFPMQHVPGTNLWHFTRRFEPDARLDYKLLVNGSEWILDPCNPHRIEGGYGLNSELRMPKYSLPHEFTDHSDYPRGTLVSSSIKSDILGNTRDIRIYIPAGYERSTEHYPVVFFHDGLDFLTLGSADRTLDFLIARRRMAPVIAVFIPPVDRNSEYAGAQMSLFDSFIVDELLPFIDSGWRTRRGSADRATIGASNGGNIALWLGLHYPETFGKIAALSGNVVSAVAGGYDHTPRLAIQFYLDMGTYDIAQMIPVMKSFVDIITAKGYVYCYRRHHEGHSWGNWRAHVGRALEMFFPPPGRLHLNRLRQNIPTVSRSLPAR